MAANRVAAVRLAGTTVAVPMDLEEKWVGRLGEVTKVAVMALVAGERAKGATKAALGAVDKLGDKMFEGFPEEMLITNEDDWLWGTHSRKPVDAPKGRR